MPTRSGFTFSAGPAMLPTAVLDWIQQDLFDWRGTGFSILEASQWDPVLLGMFTEVEQDLRALLRVPDEYAVLFLHGGASNQFAMVPLNLLGSRDRACYLHTGLWSGKAIHEARRYARVDLAASTESTGFRRVPTADEIDVDSDAAYLHYTPSETVQGLEYGYVPDPGDVPLVADYSSALLTSAIDVAQFGVIYASAQKNLGATGLTVVIVHRDLIGRADPRTPTTFDYAVHERTGSRYTTPPVFAWYLTGLMLRWVRLQGGVGQVAAACRKKADAVYAALDGSDFYQTRVDPDSRSRTSIPFLLADTALDEMFLVEAEKSGLKALRGHSSTGGLRASLYLGMPEEGARTLAEFLRAFEARYG